MNPYADVITALSRSRAPYVIIGGFAVVVHGSSRFTPDVNFVVDYDSEDALAAIDALYQAGYHGESPEMNPLDLCRSEKRAVWIDSGELHLVLSGVQLAMFSAQVLLTTPIPFSELYQERKEIEIYGTTASVCGYEHLLQLKEVAGRAQDLMDLDNLRAAKVLASLRPDQPIPQALLDQLPQDFCEARAHDLIHFNQIPPEQRVDWLVNMLAGVGSFCFL